MRLESVVVVRVCGEMRLESVVVVRVCGEMRLYDDVSSNDAAPFMAADRIIIEAMTRRAPVRIPSQKYTNGD